MLFSFIMEFLRDAFWLISYMASPNSFPKPLSAEDEKRYISRLKEGDVEAKNKLIEHNLRLVAHVAKKFSSSADSDDLISIGTIGLIKGINSYNDSRGSKLSTYIGRCIENEIVSQWRQPLEYPHP